MSYLPTEFTTATIAIIRINALAQLIRDQHPDLAHRVHINDAHLALEIHLPTGGFVGCGLLRVGIRQQWCAVAPHRDFTPTDATLTNQQMTDLLIQLYHHENTLATSEGKH